MISGDEVLFPLLCNGVLHFASGSTAGKCRSKRKSKHMYNIMFPYKKLEFQFHENVTVPRDHYAEAG